MELTFTAGIVTSTLSAPPMSEVLPFCTRTSGGFVNSTTCQEMVWPAAGVTTRNWRFVVLVISPMTGSSSLRLFWSVSSGVFDQVTKA